MSFEIPEYTSNADAQGTLRILEAIKNSKKKIKFIKLVHLNYLEKLVEKPQTENTPFYPRIIYGVAKLYSHWITVNYRKSYNIFASN